jgi:hypothetical protein
MLGMVPEDCRLLELEALMQIDVPEFKIDNKL